MWYSKSGKWPQKYIQALFWLFSVSAFNTVLFQLYRFMIKFMDGINEIMFSSTVSSAKSFVYIILYNAYEVGTFIQMSKPSFKKTNNAQGCITSKLWSQNSNPGIRLQKLSSLPAFPNWRFKYSCGFCRRVTLSTVISKWEYVKLVHLNVLRNHTSINFLFR